MAFYVITTFRALAVSLGSKAKHWSHLKFQKTSSVKTEF